MFEFTLQALKKSMRAIRSTAILIDPSMIPKMQKETDKFYIMNFMVEVDEVLMIALNQ